MRVLVTGGSGYIGNAVTEAFCRAGHSVAATVTSSGKSRVVERFGARAIVWDLGNFRSLAEEIRDCDLLVHAAMMPGADGGAVDRECVTFFLETLETTNGLRRFLYTSGVWVLGNTRGQNLPDNMIPDQSPPVVAWRPPVERLVLESAGRGLTPTGDPARGWSMAGREESWDFCWAMPRPKRGWRSSGTDTIIGLPSIGTIWPISTFGLRNRLPWPRFTMPPTEAALRWRWWPGR
jgi:NmrA-like family.